MSRTPKVKFLILVLLLFFFSSIVLHAHFYWQNRSRVNEDNSVVNTPRQEMVPRDPTLIQSYKGFASVVRFQPDFPESDYSAPQIYHVIIASEPDYGALVVTLNSLFTHNHENMRLHLITSMGSTEKMEQIVQCLKPRAQYRIYELNPSLMPLTNESRDFRKDLFHAMNFAKFYAPYMLPNSISKYFMIDADTVVLDNLAPVFEQYLQDPEYSIAAYPYGPYTKYGTVQFGHPVYEELGINMETLSESYISAGVMLVNPKRWKELGVTPLAERLVQENNKEQIYKLVTQGPINLAHKRGSIEYMDRKWNFEGLSDFKAGDHPEELMRGFEEAKIIHFSGGWKPWRFKGSTTEPYKTWNDYRMDECEVK